MKNLLSCLFDNDRPILLTITSVFVFCVVISSGLSHSLFTSSLADFGVAVLP